MPNNFPTFRQDSRRNFWTVIKADIRVANNRRITAGWYYENFLMVSTQNFLTFGILEQKISKPSIKRQYSRLSTPNWRKLVWKILDGKPSTPISFPIT